MNELNYTDEEMEPCEDSNLWNAVLGPNWTSFDVKDNADTNARSVREWLFDQIEHAKKMGLKTDRSDDFVVDYLFSEYKIRQPRMCAEGGCLYFKRRRF